MCDRLIGLISVALLATSCTIHGPQGSADDDGGSTQNSGAGAGPSSGAGGAATSGATATSTGAGATTGSGSTSSSSGAGGASTTSGSGGGSSGSGGSGGVGGNGCYTEGYDLNASLADLKSGYNASEWLSTMIDVLGRRYHNGWFVMDQMKNDPWLTGSFPQYFNLGSWGGLMEAIDTACHEETHGYDFDQALNKPKKHVFYMGSNVDVVTTKLEFFARNKILSYVQQGGSVTSSYDSTYLTGAQGSYDFIFLADELNAYIMGLACATTIGDQISGGHSYRDGVAAHLYYLQLYLMVARTQYASLYAQWKADPDWQKFVRFSWARGHYWTAVSKQFPGLGISDAAIWQRVNDPANLSEIQQFTGDEPSKVACTP